MTSARKATKAITFIQPFQLLQKFGKLAGRQVDCTKNET